MTNIYLVRHGEASASWSQSSDPGLSPRGQQQAEQVAAWFADRAPMRVISSPLARAQETATPLARQWQLSTAVDDRFREIPSNVAFDQRANWIKGLMGARWDALEADLHQWRDSARDALLASDGDCVVFTHFMLINALAGQLAADPRLVVFEPDYVSVTHLQRASDGALSVVALGRERSTVVN